LKNSGEILLPETSVQEPLEKIADLVHKEYARIYGIFCKKKLTIPMNPDFTADSRLLAIKEQLDAKERQHFSPLATLSRDGIRRVAEEKAGHRQAFSVDADRILHSLSYTRYIDKTQVFYLVRNDHITHRVLHVQLVSKIARSVGRFLGLNEDLIEAIALGHDIGHPPFGHDGEKELDRLCREHGLPSFQHNLQSVIFLDRIERRGHGWNLTLQTLDGIMCHDGEIHNRSLNPHRRKSFADFDREMAQKEQDRSTVLVPMTFEGCVVRFADTIAYIGRDIEDAIMLGLIDRRDVPPQCQEVLGNTNGSIVYRLVTDLITHSIEGDSISFSEPISESLKQLKSFNYERIYLNPALKQGFDKIRKCYRMLFETYLDHVENNQRDSAIYKDFLDSMEPGYKDTVPPPAVVRDFMAGMTDDYFLNQAKVLGYEVPEKI